jgi:hypothetical protein
VIAGPLDPSLLVGIIVPLGVGGRSCGVAPTGARR